jgi:hypothetical protein
MNYLRVEWNHSDSTEPVLLYSELDENRDELRKVEVYADGRRGFASVSESAGDSQLSKEPLPALNEIALEPFEISPEEFERVWAEAHS